jgi:mitochondrial ATPase complex subunit ATP10
VTHVDKRNHARLSRYLLFLLLRAVQHRLLGDQRPKFGAMAGKSDVLDVFLRLTLRPHPRCLQSTVRTARSFRFASTSTSPKLPERKPDTVGLRSGIPYHVGLDRNPEARSAISRIPIPKGERGEVFTPSELARPLGLRNPPRPGENSPLDKRTRAERNRDFHDPDKILERRRVMLRSYLRPYFQEWKRANHHRGKTFQSNPRLFRRDKALYFPNIWGSTLSEEGDGPNGGRDMSPVLMGHVSLVVMKSGRWAEEQSDTFVGETANPELEGILARHAPKLQRIDVNMQPDWMRALLVRWSLSRIRKSVPKERWNKYFMLKLPRDIRRGLTEDVRDAMGLLNSQIGYVYLVDSGARIRWAGSGDAWDGEVAGLNAAIVRLVEEERSLDKYKLSGFATSKSKPSLQEAAQPIPAVA